MDISGLAGMYGGNLPSWFSRLPTGGGGNWMTPGGAVGQGPGGGGNWLRAQAQQAMADPRFAAFVAHLHGMLQGQGGAGGGGFNWPGQGGMMGGGRGRLGGSMTGGGLSQLGQGGTPNVGGGGLDPQGRAPWETDPSAFPGGGASIPQPGATSMTVSTAIAAGYVPTNQPGVYWNPATQSYVNMPVIPG